MKTFFGGKKERPKFVVVMNGVVMRSCREVGSPAPDSAFRASDSWEVLCSSYAACRPFITVKMLGAKYKRWPFFYLLEKSGRFFEKMHRKFLP